MHVSALYIYPVKGIAGVPVQTARLDVFGVAGDRRFLIVNGAGEFMSQREHASLALLRGTYEAGELVLRSPHAGQVRVAAAPSGTYVRARVWHDDVDAIDAGAAAAAFVTRHVGAPARLVFMPDDAVRQVDVAYARAGDRVAFADAFPLLLIGEASLAELNRRLSQPVGMLRFRPNIVVSGAAPHEEDGWRRVRIGTVVCDVVKPCARCVVTTIDPATAVAGHEPLRTLARYRTAAGKVYFGQNLIHRDHGAIRIGDAVRVLAAAARRPQLPAV